MLLIFPCGPAPIPALSWICSTLTELHLKASRLSRLSLFAIRTLPFTPPSANPLPQGKEYCTLGVRKAPSLMREGWGGCQLGFKIFLRRKQRIFLYYINIPKSNINRKYDTLNVTQYILWCYARRRPVGRHSV